MTKFALKAALLAAPLAALLATAANAGGFYLQEQSVKGAGRAFSGEAADTGTASLWWNPAAIGGVTGLTGNFGVSAILPSGDVENRGTLIVRPGQAPTGVGGNQGSHNPINNGFLPSGAVAYGVNEHIAFGVVITSPYSFTTNYDSADWTRYTADKTYLRTVDIQPSVAVHFGEGISIGGGPNIEYSYATLSNFLPNLSPLLPDGHQGLQGKGWNVGYSVGAQYHNAVIDLGASYKSSIKHKLDGSVTTAGLLGPLAGQNGVVSTQADFRTPWMATGSVRLHATPKLTFEAQVVRIGWKKFDAIVLGAPLNTAIPENYRNTWSIAGGLDYIVSPAWTLRAGLQHDQTPTQNGQRDARVPDSDRWNLTGGASWSMSKHITIDAAAGYIFFKDASIDRVTAAYAGTPVQTPILVSGQLTNANALVFSLGGRFAF